jgi:hypothetical protein
MRCATWCRPSEGRSSTRRRFELGAIDYTGAGIGQISAVVAKGANTQVTFFDGTDSETLTFAGSDHRADFFVHNASGHVDLLHV